MTHNLIYEKFMIEYDKANVTSSYPSLTKYEVATILDKAYLALIARKLTGNNTRRVPFEYDVKAIEDLRPLITSKIVNTSTATTTASNELAFKLPDDLLYYLEGQASYTNNNSETADNKDHFNEIVNLVDHRTAQRFRATNTNMPWIKQPVSFLQGDDVYVLYDTYKHHDPLSLLVTYLEKPASFVANLVGTESGSGSSGDNPGGNSGNDEPTQPTTQLSISIHRNDFQDDTKALIAATIVVENIEDQLYVDIFEKAETSSLWTLLNTDTYDNNHRISWPVDITAYDKNVKFVIRNSNSTIKKESNVFTISSKPQTEATGNISRIQYNSTDLNIEALCQLYNTSGVVLKYYIKPISASNQAYVLYGSDEENFTTIISYTGVWKYKKAEPGFVYKVELIDKITDSVLDTKTIVVPVENSEWEVKEVYKSGWDRFLVTLQYYMFYVTWKNKKTGAICKSNATIKGLSNVDTSNDSIKITDLLDHNITVTLESVCEEDSNAIYKEEILIFPKNLFYRTINVKVISADGYPEKHGEYASGFEDNGLFISCDIRVIRKEKNTKGLWDSKMSGTVFAGNINVVSPEYADYAKDVVFPGNTRINGNIDGEFDTSTGVGRYINNLYEVIGWGDGVSENTSNSSMSRIFPGLSTNGISEFNVVVKKIQ